MRHRAREGVPAVGVPVVEGAFAEVGSRNASYTRSLATVAARGR